MNSITRWLPQLVALFALLFGLAAASSQAVNLVSSATLFFDHEYDPTYWNPTLTRDGAVGWAKEDVAAWNYGAPYWQANQITWNWTADRQIDRIKLVCAADIGWIPPFNSVEVTAADASGNFTVAVYSSVGPATGQPNPAMINETYAGVACKVLNIDGLCVQTKKIRIKYGMNGNSWARLGEVEIHGGPIITPEQYGAKANGTTNDTTAFQRAAVALKSNGGGALKLKANATYLVGRQIHTTGQQPYWTTQTVFEVANLTGAKVTVLGNNATLKLPNGIRYGSFDPVTGQRYDPSSMPFIDLAYAASAPTPISVQACAAVEIRDLTINGNISNVILGGYWGDVTRQIGGSGINVGDTPWVRLKNVKSNYNSLDGFCLHYRNSNMTASSAPTPIVLENCEFNYNARQGFSWTGGIGLTATDCKFNHTGRVGFSSTPGAGVDAEAELSVCRNGVFDRCEFINNSGCGLLSMTGDVEGVVVKNSTLWGTTSFATWIEHPSVRLEDCTIYGANVWGYGSSDPAKATQFIRCHLEDLQGGTYPSYVFNGNLNYMGGENLLFDGCTIIGNTCWPLNLFGPDTTEIVRNSTIWVRNPNAGWQNAIGFLYGTRVENSSFKEANMFGMDNCWWLGNVKVGANVTVDGPAVKWSRAWNGLTGTIPQGTYSSPNDYTP